MKEVITSQKQVHHILISLRDSYASSPVKFWGLLQTEILTHKVKFPVLEYIARDFVDYINPKQQIEFLDRLVAINQISCYVIAGKVLQLRLDAHLLESTRKASEYMILGNEWYTCDIIAERVLGMGLLNSFTDMLPILNEFQDHNNKWIQRSPGIGVHLAVKWGLPEEHIVPILELLKRQFKTKDYHVKKGCGWGIETCTKFHPEIVRTYEDELTDPSTNAWIRYKYRLGISKSKKLRAKKNN